MWSIPKLLNCCSSFTWSWARCFLNAESCWLFWRDISPTSPVSASSMLICPMAGRFSSRASVTWTAIRSWRCLACCNVDTGSGSRKSESTTITARRRKVLCRWCRQCCKSPPRRSEVKSKMSLTILRTWRLPLAGAIYFSTRSVKVWVRSYRYCVGQQTQAAQIPL